MSGYDELDTLLDGLDFDEFDEGSPGRRSMRTPSRRSSFTPRHTPAPASQSQVQSSVRNLDSKIETLGNAVKSLEARTDSLTASQNRLAATVRKEAEERKKGSDVIRADLQQTKMLTLLLPMLTQESVDASVGSKQVKVVTQSQNQFSTLLPLLLLMPGMSGGDAGKGGLGGDMMTNLLLLSMLTKK
ncbi:hypothetical protein [Streptomyces sp. NRRL S-87]|uniref:hypothetical protein n=1 Tax=Streptomyces sp. NRRL S-87 TaxID=1463920 RepID=UPI0004C21F19|nr:hypothetical protein [Streptomyces sp. NRRL S-87]